jgi:prepilin-type N-terminal cleavage/methylation domain-containing protein
MRRLRLRDEGGVTLIEMIMVLAILGIVLGGVTTVFISGSRAELSVNNKFQAQEASRLAMASIRRDMHSACAAAVTATNMQVTLSIPILDKSQNPPVAPNAATQCGTVNAANIAKIVYLVCASPTNGAKFAIYRLTAAPPATPCPSAGKLVADNLVNTLPNYTGFFNSNLTAGAINWGETQTVDVDIPVSLKQGQAGAPFDLRERIALSNTVWGTTSPTLQDCSVAVPCSPGPCDNVDVSGTHLACYPVHIS